MPSNVSLLLYVLLGLVFGVLAVLVTKLVYVIEDVFEKLPIHWMWWPALGGLVVGVIGYFAPGTIGVGYDNIRYPIGSDRLRFGGFSVCVLKFISWPFRLEAVHQVVL